MEALAIDPVIARSCSSALALILLHGAWHKLRDLALFEASVELYRLLPQALLTPFARSFPLLELLAAVGLLFEATRGAGALLALAVLGCATLAVAINVARGHTGIDCGCGGADGATRLSTALVLRNLGLIALLAVGAQTGSARVAVWMDYLTVVAATLMLIALYAAGNQLLANHPRLSQLRQGS